MARKPKFEQELRKFGIRNTKDIEETLSNYTNGQEVIDTIANFSKEYKVAPENIYIELRCESDYYDSYTVEMVFSASIPKSQDELESEINEKKAQLAKEHERQEVKDALEYERLKKKFEKEEKAKAKKNKKAKG